MTRALHREPFDSVGVRALFALRRVAARELWIDRLVGSPYTRSASIRVDKVVEGIDREFERLDGIGRSA